MLPVLVAALSLLACAPRTAAAPKRDWPDLSADARATRLSRELGLDYRHVALRQAVIRFVEVAAEPFAASAAPILFVHGIGGSLGDFGPVMLLARGKARLVALDLPGFGGSTSADHDYSMRGLAKVLSQFIERLELAPVRLACHSLGGQICLTLALEKRELVRDLTLVAPAGIYRREEFVQETSRRFGISTGHIQMDDPSRSFASLLTHGDDLILRHLVGNDPLTIAALASFRENLHDRLRELRVSTVVVWGKDDPVLPMADGFALAASSPAVTLRVIENARHTPQLTHPEKVDACMHPAL
jgi:2-hydroxy-6-oxonona-2,4-dienedioate hydrolase